MNIQHLREFVVLARYLNYSLAAQHLNMTQPGLSRHISQIENELAVTLFERNTRKVHLTEKGEEFLQGIQKLINDFDFLCDSVSSTRTRSITISCPYLCFEKYLSQPTNLFESEYPEVAVDYLPAYPDQILSGLLSMEIDVAVMARPSSPISKELICHDIFEEPVALLLNQDHPLAKRTHVQLNELKYENFISLKGRFGKAMFANWCTLLKLRGNTSPTNVIEAKTIEEAALRMKPDGGVMLLPGNMKNVHISPNIIGIDIVDIDCTLTISLYRHPDNLNPVIDKFIDFFLKQSFEN